MNGTEHLKLYRWDRDAAPGHRLVDLTAGGFEGSQLNALDIVGASTDETADPESDAAPGNTVYFVAGTPEALYRWRWNGGAPSLDRLAPYVSTWESGDSESGSAINENVEDPNVDRRHVRITPDGRYVVIQTRLRYEPVADQDSDQDLYRWDEAGGWTCISCQRPGAASAGNVDSYTPRLAYNGFFHDLGGQVPEHTISDDGQRVFFSTPDALVPQDVNGEEGCPREEAEGTYNAAFYRCADVYEWDDGTVSLLTSGTGSHPFHLMGATASGRDVFFATRQRLAGWDRDNSVDIYDARSGGGFAEPAAQPPACEGEACRGAVTAAPAASGAGTAVFEGPGNPKPKHANKRRKHRKRHHKTHRRHSKRHARAHPRKAHGKRHRAHRRAANNYRRTAR